MLKHFELCIVWIYFLGMLAKKRLGREQKMHELQFSFTCIKKKTMIESVSVYLLNRAEIFSSFLPQTWLIGWWCVETTKEATFPSHLKDFVLTTQRFWLEKLNCRFFTHSSHERTPQNSYFLSKVQCRK